MNVCIYCRVSGFRDSKKLLTPNLMALFIGIFTVITAVVHFTNVQHINQRHVFWYHFTFTVLDYFCPASS
jgi:hypothetical protein